MHPTKATEWNEIRGGKQVEKNLFLNLEGRILMFFVGHFNADHILLHILIESSGITSLTQQNTICHGERCMRCSSWVVKMCPIFFVH